jgi:hypothetical protein
LENRMSTEEDLPLPTLGSSHSYVMCNAESSWGNENRYDRTVGKEGVELETIYLIFALNVCTCA